MEQLLLKEIPYQSADYNSAVFLRDKILREPLGLSLYQENLGQEQNDIHLGAFINSSLVGVLILTKLGQGDYKMRQVAVEEAFQGKGIGKKLVCYAEEFAKQKGGLKMVLHSRKTAVDFYEKLGYTTIGGEFIEVTIPHKMMLKKL